MKTARTNAVSPLKPFKDAVRDQKLDILAGERGPKKDWAVRFRDIREVEALIADLRTITRQINSEIGIYDVNGNLVEDLPWP